MFLRGRKKDQPTTTPTAIAVGCATPQQYVAVALDASAINRPDVVPRFPVLAEGLSVAPRSISTHFILEEFDTSPSYGEVNDLDVAQLVELCQNRCTVESKPGDAAVIVVADDSAVLVGSAHALLANKRLLCVEAWELEEAVVSAFPDARSLTIALSLESTQATSLIAIGEAINRRSAGVERTPWGVLTATDKRLLSFLVARIAARSPSSDPRAMVIAQVQMPFPVVDDRVQVILDPRGEIAIARHLLEHEVPLAILSAHGTNYCAAHGNLCSRSSVDSEATLDCINGMECPHDVWPRIPARDLPLDVLVALSCDAARFGDMPGGGAPLAVQLQEGFACATIAPVTSAQVSSWLPFYIWHLASLGQRIGEVLTATRRANSLISCQASKFVLFGDPEMQVFSALESRSALLRPERLPDGAWSLVLPTRSAGVVCHLVDHPEFVSELQSTGLHATTPPGLAGGSIVIAIYEDPGRATILTAWAPGLPGGAVEVRFTPHSPLRTWVIDAAEQFLVAVRLDHSSEGSHAPDPGGVEFEAGDPTFSLVEFMDAKEPELVSRLGIPQLGPHDYANLKSDEATILELCQRAGDAILDGMLSVESLWFFRYYAMSRGIRYLEEKVVAGGCDNCGATTVERAYSSGLGSARIRHWAECERCSWNSDLGGSISSFTLRSPELCERGAGIEVILSGRSRLTHPALVQGGLTIDLSRDHFCFEPAKASCVCEAEGAFELRFRVDHTNGPREYVRMKAIVLLNGEASMLVKAIDVVDPAR